jgi:hypothetical protein
MKINKGHYFTRAYIYVRRPTLCTLLMAVASHGYVHRANLENNLGSWDSLCLNSHAGKKVSFLLFPVATNIWTYRLELFFQTMHFHFSNLTMCVLLVQFLVHIGYI